MMAEIQNIPGLAEQAFLGGESYINRLFDNRAQRQAGQAYARGDYTGAQAALANRGDIQGARQIGQDQRQIAMDQSQAARTQRTDDKQEQKDRADMMLQATRLLRQVPPERRKEAFAQLAPAIFPPEFIQQVQQYDLTDEQLDAFGAALEGEVQKLQGVNLGNGGFGSFDPRTGAFEVLQEPQQRAPSGFEFGPDGQLQYIPGGPADPRYAGQVSGARREAVVSRPMPKQSSGGSGSAPSVGTPPWKRKW